MSETGGQGPVDAPRPNRPRGPTRVTDRSLTPSRYVRDVQRRAGGGRDRDALVHRAGEMIRKGSKSFHAASRLFDTETRERAWMLYAWCRQCDDIVDGQTLGHDMDGGADTPEKAMDRLEAIRILTARAFAGEPTADLAFDALGQVASETGIRPEDAEDVIAGFELDARDWRPRTEKDLMRYCYHVAGAVGVMMARVMGVPADDSETLDRACDLGLAFQLANIARDLAEDDANGRCYVPAEWLAAEDIEPGQLMKPHHRREVADIAHRLVAMARAHRSAALAGTNALGFRQRWAIHAAARIYGEIAEEVDRRGPAAWDRRVVVSRPRKAGHGFGAFFDALKTSHELPDEMPRHSRTSILIDVRMNGPIPGPPMTPLPDEE